MRESIVQNFPIQAIKHLYCKAGFGLSPDGWAVRRPGVHRMVEQPVGNGTFVFRRMQHDYGRKTFMGKTGDFDGGYIIDIILEPGKSLITPPSLNRMLIPY